MPDMLSSYSSTIPRFLSYTNDSSNYNQLYWNTFENVLNDYDIITRSVTASDHITSYNFIGVASNLFGINLNDRDTSLLKEGSNLYYTHERVGTITNSSNIKSMNYTLQNFQ